MYTHLKISWLIIPHEFIWHLLYLYHYSLTSIQLALAKVIPVVNGQINVICGEAPNQFIQVRDVGIWVLCVRPYYDVYMGGYL